jgi:hypothetical protein
LHRLGTTEARSIANTARPIYPTWTPDGSRIVFDTDAFAEAHVVVARAGRNTLLAGARGTADVFARDTIRLSPDGSMLTFLRDLPKGGVLELWRTAGGKIRTIPLRGYFPVASAWAPDGKHLVVGEAASPERLVVIDLKGSHRRVIAQGAVMFRWVSWAQNTIVFPGQLGRVFAVRPDGTGKKELPGLKGAEGVLLSPEGTMALYNVGGGEYYLARVDGSMRRQLGRAYSHASWSPDGSELVVPDSDGVAAQSVTGAPSRRWLAHDTVRVWDASWSR